MPDQALAALVAVVAACVYVTGLALQQQGNRRAVARGHRGIVAVLRQPIWWLGIAVTCAGFVVHGFSLTIGSLTVVQPVQVTEIVFAVALDAWIAKAPISRSDWQGTAFVVVGLGAFMAVTQPTAGTDFASAGSWAWILAALGGLGVVLSLAAWRFPTRRAVLFGALAGAIFGVQGALLKESSELIARGLVDALTTWPVYATALLGLFGLIAQNAALRAGRLATAAALITVVNPIVSSAIGLTAFSESMRSGVPALLGATVAAVVATWGVALLSRHRAVAATVGVPP